MQQICSGCQLRKWGSGMDVSARNTRAVPPGFSSLPEGEVDADHSTCWDRRAIGGIWWEPARRYSPYPGAPGASGGSWEVRGSPDTQVRVPQAENVGQFPGGDHGCWTSRGPKMQGGDSQAGRVPPSPPLLCSCLPGVGRSLCAQLLCACDQTAAECMASAAFNLSLGSAGKRACQGRRPSCGEHLHGAPTAASTGSSSEENSEEAVPDPEGRRRTRRFLGKWLGAVGTRRPHGPR